MILVGCKPVVVLPVEVCPSFARLDARASLKTLDDNCGVMPFFIYASTRDAFVTYSEARIWYDLNEYSVDLTISCSFFVSPNAHRDLSDNALTILPVDIFQGLVNLRFL